MPLAVPSQRGFTKQRETARQRDALAPPRPTPTTTPGATGTPAAATTARVQRLVERERERERVRAELRDAQHLEQHGRPGLAVPACRSPPRSRARRRARGSSPLAAAREQRRAGGRAAAGGVRAARSPPRAPARVASGSYSTCASVRIAGPARIGAEAGRRRGRSRDEPCGAAGYLAAPRRRAGPTSCGTMRPRPLPERGAALIRAIALALTVLTGLQRPRLRGDLAEVPGDAARLAQRGDGRRARALPRRALGRLLAVRRAHAPRSSRAPTRAARRRACCCSTARSRAASALIALALPAALPRRAARSRCAMPHAAPAARLRARRRALGAADPAAGGPDGRHDPDPHPGALARRSPTRRASTRWSTPSTPRAPSSARWRRPSCSIPWLGLDGVAARDGRRQPAAPARPSSRSAARRGAASRSRPRRRRARRADRASASSPPSRCSSASR